MAENLILYDLTPLGSGADNLVLDDRAVTGYEQSVEGLIFWRWNDEPENLPQYLGMTSAGAALEVPFTITDGREVRLFLVSRTADGDQTVTDPRRSLQQYVYTPPATGGDAIVTHLGEIVTRAGDVVTHTV